MRKSEAINSFNLIVKLTEPGQLDEYYDKDLSILQHFKEPWNVLFLRGSKNTYITAVDPELLRDISQSKAISYNMIRKRLAKANLTLRLKEIRSYFATYLRNHGILPEYIDIYQGRVGKSIFQRHYMKIEDLRALSMQILKLSKELETTVQE